MLIKSIKLKNFQCYFGDEHEIIFTTGLNIITGSIASGKSKLFDAFYWVLNDKIFVTGNDWVSTKNLGISFVSDKAKYESQNIDDLIETSVEIVVKTTSGKSSTPIEYTIKRQYLISRKTTPEGIKKQSAIGLEYAVRMSNPFGLIHSFGVTISLK